MEEKLDVIVVGAGPAGSAAAFTLAKAGFQVLLVERGKTPGEKNITGGVLYGQVLHEIIPNFWEEAPIERCITTHRLTFLSKGTSTTIDFKTKKFAAPPYNCFSILRRKFDEWFANKAEEAGALLAAGIRVDDLLWEAQQIVGVKAGEDDVFADVVIAADGVNSLLAEKAKLRKTPLPKHMGLGIKEIITLSRDVLEERFILSGNEGVAHLFVGCTKGYPGGGFLYTNLDSLSLGMVIHLSAFTNAKIKAQDLMEYFKTEPIIDRLIQDGTVREYSAHLIPEGGYKALSNLYSDGFLVTGDAAGLAINVGYSVEGMNFAIASGIAAAEAVKSAKKHGDYSKKALKRYRHILERNFVLKDLKTFQRAPVFFKNPRIYGTYPLMINTIVEDLFTSKGVPRKKLWKILRHRTLERASIPQLILDGIQTVRAL
ncbi:MAG: FAD-dependent oxidoreductase [Promethearchaeota archaeon]